VRDLTMGRTSGSSWAAWCARFYSDGQRLAAALPSESRRAGRFATRRESLQSRLPVALQDEAGPWSDREAGV